MALPLAQQINLDITTTAILWLLCKLTRVIQQPQLRIGGLHWHQRPCNIISLDRSRHSECAETYSPTVPSEKVTWCQSRCDSLQYRTLHAKGNVIFISIKRSLF